MKGKLFKVVPDCDILGKTYNVSPYESQRSHPSINLGVKLDLCVLFVLTAVRCQDCKLV